MNLRHKAFAALAGIVVAAGAAAAATPANAAPTTVPDGHCVISKTDRNRTVDSLRNHCTSEQILDLFAAAPLGTAPTGRLPLALLPVMHAGTELMPYARAKFLTQTQNRFGDHLTFTTRGHQPWVYKNYTFGDDIGAAVTLGTSNWDHKPAWTADFSADFFGRPVSVHEYRQLTPTVWIGRDTSHLSKDPAKARNSGGAMAIG